MTTPPLGQPTPPKPRKKLGCWFYGCTTLFLLVVLGLVGMYFAARYTVNTLRDNYTSTQPVALERIELPPTEWTNLQERIQGFTQALDQGQAHELVLTEKELNAFLDNTPKYKEMGDRVHLTIQGEQLGGQISWPIPDISVFKMTGMGGRYLNGNATFEVKLQDGELEVFLQDLKVNDKPLPDEFNKELRKNNLAKDFQQDADTTAALAKYQSITVTDGKVVLKSKGQPAAP